MGTSNKWRDDPMSDRKRSFEERLAAHPELRDRFEQILKLVEDVDEQINTADEAEERAIEELRRLGNEILHDWAIHKDSQTAQQTFREKPKANSNGKKNSPGTPRSGR
jgi:hypothetical protein